MPKSNSWNLSKFLRASILAGFAALVSINANALCADPSGLSLHGAITHDALGGLLGVANLKEVIDANDSQDAPAGDGAQEKRRHFDGANMTAAVGYINREKTRAIELAGEADSDSQSRSDALRHFGLMLHSVQDFYLRSNYVELQLEDEHNRESPYDIALVDWSRLPDGYCGSSSRQKLAAARQGDASDMLNKELSESSAAKKSISGKATQLTIARELAVRETQRQWNLFETLIRGRCGNRAAAVLAALKQAPPEGDANSQKQASE